MTTVDDSASQILAEFARLGLDVTSSPSLVTGGADGAATLLARLCAMAPGVTWREVYPEMPAHWIANQPHTWTVPYVPLGVYDYPVLPAGAAIHIGWARDTDRSCLDAFIREARADGWPLYDAGFHEAQNPEWPYLDAHVIVERGADADAVMGFFEWINTRPRVQAFGIIRSGTERYFPG